MKPPRPPGEEPEPHSSRETTRASETVRAPASPDTRSKMRAEHPQFVPVIHEDEAGGTNITKTSTQISPQAKAPGRDILTVNSGPNEGHVYALKMGETWIGRSDDCEIVLLGNGVSRRHACITVTRSRVVLRENLAKNGTFVNEERIIGERELKPGDEIQLGRKTSLVYSRVHGLGSAGRKRAQDIASMVAGVAHQINTPLGVAQTASALIESLAEELRRNPTGEHVAELLGDLRASAGFVSKNIERTHELVKSFKQLSGHELTGDYREDDLVAIVRDSVDAARPVAEQQEITLVAHGLTETEFPWLGFPIAMGKVIEHLLQHRLRHAYEGRKGGVVDIRLKLAKARYRLEVEDYGVGIATEMAARIFDPFVSANHPAGTDGLGLAVVHMIVTTLFGGTITCTSIEGRGAKFVIMIPLAVSEGG